MKLFLKILMITAFTSSFLASAQAQTRSGNCSMVPGKYRKCTYSGTPAEQHMKALGAVTAGILGIAVLGAMLSPDTPQNATKKKSSPLDDSHKRNQRAANNAALLLKLFE